MSDDLILRARGLTKRFGGVTAVNSIDLDVATGELLALLGPNGAGKSSLFNLIAGAVKPDAGTVEAFGTDVTGSPAHKMCAYGLARTFQLVRPLAGMTVRENAMVGAFARTSSVREAERMAMEALEVVGIEGLADTRAANLTLGFRKRLEVARALATQPKLLLLDEMMAGLNPAELDRFIEVLRGVHRQGVTLIVVEHVVHAVMQLATRIVVMSQGSKIADGEPHAVMASDRVIQAYLGENLAVT